MCLMSLEGAVPWPGGKRLLMADADKSIGFHSLGLLKSKRQRKWRSWPLIGVSQSKPKTQATGVS